ncbi:MAG: cadherin repeat domain-containing protein, partial [Caldilineaceae bacterium SB0668_bin_21]|nr:cadherin repeat domain-containing protein [Caldilineaceae bacterium SB0668_bin_21]
FIAHRNVAFILIIFLAILGLRVTSYADVIPVGEPQKKAPLDNVKGGNTAPVFTDGERTIRRVTENTAAGVNIGRVVAATDADDQTLTYSLGGRDADAFDIDASAGQLKTKAALNYETKDSYTVTVTVSDGRLEDSIVVTVSVRNVNEAPVFVDGENTIRHVAENTAAGVNFGPRVSATDPDANATLTYSLSGRNADAFAINSRTGQLQTKAALNYETKDSYTVTVIVSDGSLTNEITVTINVKNVNEAPVFADGENTTRQVDENTAAGVNFGPRVSATDPDANATLTYNLSGGNADAFVIDNTTGQLQTKAALDYETKDSYTVSVMASDGKLTDKIVVTINVKNVNEAPVFSDGKNTTRQVDENTAAGTSIGRAVAATDVDNRILVYSLGGRDAAAFGIHSTTGQLKTEAVLDYETKNSYTVTVTASDSSLTDEITVTINVKNVNEAPVFTDGENTIRQVDENTAAGANIGRALAATDVDNRALIYSLAGRDATAFGIHSTTGQLKTKAALDYETKDSYTVSVMASDGKLADKIVVTINVKDVNEAPVFGDGENTTRQVDENTAAGVNFGPRVSATDPDANATLTYSLGGGDAAAFAIDSTTGQLQTKAALDYETKNSYTLTATVSDGRLVDTIDITINVTDVYENRAPVFTEGTSTIRSVAENTAADENIGTAVSATDPDDDTLTYSLAGTDASSFSLDSSSGQLKTKAALDHETKDNYSVTVSVSDADNVTDSITVTISVTDANDAPVFADGTSITRSVAENTASGQNIGSPISATDEDAGTTLTYTLGGTDAAAFSIVNASGQLKTSAALNYETKSSYAVTVTVSDGNLTDTMSVSISVTDTNEAPLFSGADPIIRGIAENTISGINIGSPISATDEDAGTTLT